MTKQANFKLTRRDLLKGGGALVVTFGMPWLHDSPSRQSCSQGNGLEEEWI